MIHSQQLWYKAMKNPLIKTAKGKEKKTEKKLDYKSVQLQNKNNKLVIKHKTLTVNQTI